MMMKKTKYTDISSGDFPKTLMIRNHKEGLIWQIYHVDNKEQVDILTNNCWGNGFYGSTLENFQPEREETWSNWRESCSDNLKAEIQKQIDDLLSSLP